MKRKQQEPICYFDPRTKCAKFQAQTSSLWTNKENFNNIAPALSMWLVEKMTSGYAKGYGTLKDGRKITLETREMVKDQTTSGIDFVFKDVPFDVTWHRVEVYDCEDSPLAEWEGSPMHVDKGGDFILKWSFET